MLRKIIAFIKSLFSKTPKYDDAFIKEDEIKAEPKVEDNIEEEIPEDPIEYVDAECDPSDLEETSAEDEAEEEVDQDQQSDSNTDEQPIDDVPVLAEPEICKEVEYKTFTDDEKASIIDLIRPIIKGLNTDSLYMHLCDYLAESKVLKTFGKVSEDGKEITIKLTQNNIFNSKIADFVSEHVTSTFKSNINILGSYEITASDGVISIKKVG